MAHRDLIRENAWMFEHQPAAEEIEPLLKEVPAWHGSDKLDPPVMMDAYQGYVISIKQTMGRGNDAKTVWRLYTTVSGKIAIMHDAHRNADGTIIPLNEDIEIEYRNSLAVVKGTITSPIYGTVSEVGTGCMGDGASGADKTNPLENAYTSWRGRAASALCGAGILPYTGIASAEEVQTAQHRDEMADRGYRVHTPESQPQASDAAPRTNPTAKALESLKKTLKWSTEEDVEKGVAEYLQSIGTTYDGTAIDYISTQPINVIQKVLAYHKAK